MASTSSLGSSRILIPSCTNHRPCHTPSAAGVRSIVSRPSFPAISSRPSRGVRYRSQPVPPKANVPPPRNTTGLWSQSTRVLDSLHVTSLMASEPLGNVVTLAAEDNYARDHDWVCGSLPAGVAGVQWLEFFASVNTGLDTLASLAGVGSFYVLG